MTCGRSSARSNRSFTRVSGVTRRQLRRVTDTAPPRTYADRGRLPSPGRGEGIAEPTVHGLFTPPIAALRNSTRCRWPSPNRYSANTASSLPSSPTCGTGSGGELAGPPGWFGRLDTGDVGKFTCDRDERAVCNTRNPTRWRCHVLHRFVIATSNARSMRMLEWVVRPRPDSLSSNLAGPCCAPVRKARDVVGGAARRTSVSARVNQHRRTAAPIFNEVFEENLRLRAFRAFVLEQPSLTPLMDRAGRSA